MSSQDQNKIQGVKAEAKKPYRKPQLQVYGDLSSITGNASAGSMADGNGKGNSKS